MPAILKVIGLTKRFGELVALNNLTFEVEKGEVFGIAGPNGAGKTTLFNVISGFYTGTGEIFLEGRQINGLRPFQICRLGLARTFQIPTVFSTLSVYDNVRVGAHFGGDTREEDRVIRDMLDFVGLKGKEKLEAKYLCLFDKKLTMLAAALATRPRLLLLDEPVGGLSPTEIQQSLSLFERINRDLGVTLIVIEHLMSVLASISNRLMILHNGEKIIIGPPEKVARDRRVIDIYLGEEYA